MADDCREKDECGCTSREELIALQKGEARSETCVICNESSSHARVAKCRLPLGLDIDKKTNVSR